MMFQSINPVNNLLLEQFPLLTDLELDRRLEDAQKLYQHFWRQQPLDQRITTIQNLAIILEKNTPYYARLISLEMGKPISQSLAELKKSIWLCHYYTEVAPDILKDQDLANSQIIYQALGAVLGIMPWNFPFWQTCRFAIPALLAGNAVFLKPAPNVPQCGLALQAAFSEAIGRPSVFTTLFIDETQVARAIEHPLIQGIALTGSDRAGSAVGQLAGKAIKKCVLELGGSDAFIVLEDADIDQAAIKAVKSRLNNTGQTCIAAKRFIVVDTVADDFTQKVVAAMKKVSPDNPMDENTVLSTLARPDILENLQRQVDQSVKMGAKVVLDGGKQSGPGNFFKPMVLTEVTPGMPAYDEELFGPVAVIFRVADEAQAITQANDTVYGLGAAIWTRDLQRAKRVAAALEVGAIAINNLLHSDPRLPFGGVKRSGFGKELGREGLLEFVNQKTISYSGV